MKIIECIHTCSDCYGSSRKSANQIGIVIHSTGTNNPYIKRFSQPSKDDPSYAELMSLIGANRYGNHWNRHGVSKAVHYIIGKLSDDSIGIVKNLPEEIACWGVGKGKKGSYNYDPHAHIQFEICEDDLKDEKYFRQIYQAAVSLCSDICKRYGWEESVIVSHKEAHANGYGSNHADIDHWFKKYSLTMNDFRRNVKAELEKKDSAPIYRVQVGVYRNRSNAEKMKERLINCGYPAVIKEDTVTVL